MPGLWKAWKAEDRLPTLSTSPLEIPPETCGIPTFPQLRRRRRMEKWKTKTRFPTFPPPRFLSLKNSKPRRGRLRPPPGATLRAALLVPFSSAPVVYFHSALDILGRECVSDGRLARWVPIRSTAPPELGLQSPPQPGTMSDLATMYARGFAQWQAARRGAAPSPRRNRPPV
jgi:hypothetical protein